MSEAPPPWVDGLTIPQVFKRSAAAHRERDAAVFLQQDVRWTFAEYEQRAATVARALISLGIQPGDHIGIWSSNYPQWVLVQFGAAMAGAVLVNLNPAYLTREAAYVVEHADLVALIINDSFKSNDMESMVAKMAPELETAPFGGPLSNTQFPKLRHVISIQNETSKLGIWPWSDFLALAEKTPPDRLEEIAAHSFPEQPVSIQYTSGTTGKPKGAMLSHRNILMNAYYIGKAMGVDEDDSLCSPMPFFHCFGCVAGSLTALIAGIPLVVPSDWFNPETVLAAVERERCTTLYGVPAMFQAELYLPNFGDFDLSTLRKGLMAGSICPPDLCKRLNEEMNLTEMILGYGLTECSPAATLTSAEEPIELRLQTVGKSIPGVEVRVISPYTMEDIPLGDQGELAVRGHNVMIGYYKRPEATAETIGADGWLRTGDLGHRTETGHFQITGRSKDVIVRGGENVYPREVEEFLSSHPKVRDVQVTGLPDERFGEQVCAWIVPSEPDALTEDEVIQFSKENISRSKVPHYVVFVEDYPMTASGKVQKYKLRDIGIKKFGLASGEEAVPAT